MGEIAKILFPVYDLDEAQPTLEHTIWFAKKFHSSILIAAVIRRPPSIQFLPVYGGPGIGPMPSPVFVERRLQGFRVDLSNMVSELAVSVNEAGVPAEAITFKEPLRQELLTVARVCDLLIESCLHQHGLISYLLGKKDVYTDSCCPLLVSKGKPFKLSPILLVYCNNRAANEALRWIVRLAKSRKEKVNVCSLIIWRDEEERKRLDSELTEYAQAHGLGVEVAFVKAKEGFHQLSELSKQLVPGFVAMPMHAFDWPFHLRLRGMDETALDEIQASALLFP